MPFIKVETNQSLDSIQAGNIAKELSALVADMLGKPEAYVLAIFEEGKTILFGGDDGPAAFVTMDSIGFPEEKTTEFSATICSFLESALEIPGNRVYIAFGDIKRNLFGWDSKTF